MANLDETVGNTGSRLEVTGWAIIAISKEETEEEKKVWQECTPGRETLRDGCSTKEVGEDAVWMEASLTDILNSYAKHLSVTACSKQ